MRNDLPERKSVEIRADLYDFFAERAASYNRPVETMIEAIIASRRVQCLGGSNEQISQEFAKWMNISNEEYVAKVSQTTDIVRRKRLELRQNETGGGDEFSE